MKGFRRWGWGISASARRGALTAKMATRVSGFSDWDEQDRAANRGKSSAHPDMVQSGAAGKAAVHLP
jgi:hypothetical protein